MRKSMMVMCSALVMAGAASAGELPKEGKITGGTYYGSGTYKTAAIGKDGGISGWDEIGYTTGSPLIEHVSWRCMGGYYVFAGKAQWNGRCVGTDTAGDQLIGTTESADDAPPWPESKTRQGKFTLIGGTGKYAGISGGWTFVNHAGELRPPSDDSYALTATDLDGFYKLQ